MACSKWPKVSFLIDFWFFCLVFLRWSMSQPRITRTWTNSFFVHVKQATQAIRGKTFHWSYKQENKSTTQTENSFEKCLYLWRSSEPVLADRLLCFFVWLRVLKSHLSWHNYENQDTFSIAIFSEVDKKHFFVTKVVFDQQSMNHNKSVCWRSHNYLFAAINYEDCNSSGVDECLFEGILLSQRGPFK